MAQIEYHALVCYTHSTSRNKSLKTERCTACNLDMIKKSIDFCNRHCMPDHYLHSKKNRCSGYVNS